jgi:hypothetical protein
MDKFYPSKRWKDFYYSWSCKACENKRERERYSENKEKRLAKCREYRQNNKAKISAYHKRRKAGRTPDQVKLERDKSRAYLNKRISVDVPFRLLLRCRTRIYDALKFNRKSARTQELIGCTIQFLKGYLEAQFKPGWTWDDWGPVFEIDHIVPCDSFDMSDPVQQKECFHYTNLRPLCKKQNRLKWHHTSKEYVCQEN